MESQTPEAELILEVVRGERSWCALASLGIAVVMRDGTYEVTNPRRWRAVAGAADVAYGLVRHQGQPEALRRWASVLLSGATFLELALDDHLAGDLLLSALWDASFGDPLVGEVLHVVEQVARPAHVSPASAY